MVGVINADGALRADMAGAWREEKFAQRLSQGFLQDVPYVRRAVYWGWDMRYVRK